MRRGKVAELEDRLNEIRNRRLLLENAFAEKQSLLQQLDHARTESIKRLIVSIEEQNQLARERNLKFLEEILLASHQPSNLSTSSNASFASDTSQDSRKRLIEAKKHYVKMMENALPSIHRSETIRLEEKMRKLQIEKMQSLQRREKLRQELAQEERVKVELEHQRRELVQSLALEQRDLMEAEASSVYLAAEGKLVDEQIKLNVNSYGQQLEYLLQDRLRYYSTKEATSRMEPDRIPPLREVARPAVVNSHPAEQLAAQYVDHQASTHQYQQQHPDQLYSNSSSSANQGREEVLAFQKDRVIPRMPVPLSETKPASLTFTEEKSHEHPVETHIENKAEEKDQSSFESSDVGTWKREEAKSTVIEEKEELSNHEFTFMSQDSAKQNRDAKDSKQIENDRVRDIDSEFDNSIDSYDHNPAAPSSIQNQSIETSRAESKTIQSPSSSSKHHSQSKTISEDKLPNLEEMDLGRCQSICNQLFSSIVNKITFDTKVSDIYREHRLDEDIRAVKYYIQDLLDNEDKQVSPRTNRLQGDIILTILAAKGEHLIPKDAFAGVVTMDKLKKELKKSHIAGVLHFWEAIIKHLQSIVEVNEAAVEYLAKCFTAALVQHVTLDDRERLHRKLFTLLKVSIIPDEKDDVQQSPYRRNNEFSNISSSFLDPFVTKLQDNSKPSTTNNSSASSNTTTAIATNTNIVPKKFTDFDDDEIASEDSFVEKPPQIKDLDELQGNNNSNANNKNTNFIMQRGPDDVDEFDF